MRIITVEEHFEHPEVSLRDVVRADVTEFLTGAGLSEADTHAIAHANVEALLRI